jgi:hypothetical protein
MTAAQAELAPEARPQSTLQARCPWCLKLERTAAPGSPTIGALVRPTHAPPEKYIVRLGTVGDCQLGLSTGTVNWDHRSGPSTGDCQLASPSYCAQVSRVLSMLAPTLADLVMRMCMHVV